MNLTACSLKSSELQVFGNFYKSQSDSNRISHLARQASYAGILQDLAQKQIRGHFSDYRIMNLSARSSESSELNVFENF